jgi:hypothetical protein
MSTRNIVSVIWSRVALYQLVGLLSGMNMLKQDGGVGEDGRGMASEPCDGHGGEKRDEGMKGVAMQHASRNSRAGDPLSSCFLSSWRSSFFSAEASWGSLECTFDC